MCVTETLTERRAFSCHDDNPKGNQIDGWNQHGFLAPTFSVLYQACYAVWSEPAVKMIPVTPWLTHTPTLSSLQDDRFVVTSQELPHFVQRNKGRLLQMFIRKKFAIYKKPLNGRGKKLVRTHKEPNILWASLYANELWTLSRVIGEHKPLLKRLGIWEEKKKKPSRLAILIKHPLHNFSKDARVVQVKEKEILFLDTY